MAPKKKEQTQKMSLSSFMNDSQYGGSWADEVEDVVGSQPLPLPSSERRSYAQYGAGMSERIERGGYSVRDSFPTQLPTKPPYTAHLGNLSYDATSEAVTDFFADCEITSVRIIEDRIENRPKGFAYAEFATLDGLKKALELDGTSFQGRTIKVRIADPPKDRGDGGMARENISWERKGPLADAPRGNDRRPNDFGERRQPSFRDNGPVDDGRVRDFGNWERKGPLSPVQPERSMSRDDSRTRNAARTDSFQGGERKVSPATWGEGRPEGSRGPPREFGERPERPERVERAPTAADLDNQWRTSMRPDAPVKSSEQSREGSEAPSSPAPASAVPAPGGRPRLALAKRTISEAPDASATSAGGDAKASPFGAARPIDTAAKEREIADKREQTLKEKKEADDKAKEDRRLAKEAAAKEAEEKAAADAEAEAEAKAKADAATAAAEAKPETPAEASAEPTEDGASDEKLPTKPKENVQNAKPRPSESGNWRTSSGEQRQGRGGYVNAPRGRGDARGRGGAPRGPRGGAYEGRGPRSNGNAPAAAAAAPTAPQQSAPAAAAEGEAAAPQDPDGWTTVSSTKGRRQNRV